MRAMKRLMTIALVFGVGSLALIALSAQAPVNCDGPLTDAKLIGLLRGAVSERRVLQWIETCGVGFEVSPEREQVLRDAGATKAVLESVRRASGRRGQKSATSAGQPDFSGRWRELPDARGFAGDALRTITHTTRTLTVEITSGRGSSKEVYSLEGSISENPTPAGITWRSTARWEGDKLIITTSWSVAVLAKPIVRTATWSLTPDGNLQIVLEQAGRGGQRIVKLYARDAEASRRTSLSGQGNLR